MEILQTYQVLAIPVFAGFITQVLKILTRHNGQKFELKSMIAYSGMPSGHSAIVISLSTIIALVEGIDSTAFAISMILSAIVIRDALGIRRYLGEHGHILNVLVKDLGNDHVLENKYPHLLENIGHTPLQALVGSLIGFAISIIGFILLN